jgi:hypothetical protein
LPKTTRGRRPAPNPKKRPQRPLTRTTAVAAPPIPGIMGEGGAVATTPAPRPMPVAAAPARRVPHAAPRRRFADSISDYAYVPGDLRRIGLWALSLIALLVILSLFVR